MYGLKLFGITALAANNKASFDQQSVGMKSAGTPFTTAEVAPAFGRRQALQNILGVAAVAAAPAMASALDMDAFMSSEVRICIGTGVVRE